MAVIVTRADPGSESGVAVNIYYVHNDHLNTPQILTDGTQQAIWQVESQTPFGELEINEDPDGDGRDIVFNVRFPGQYYDSESHTSYNYFRTYDQSLGRYIQSDPIGALYDFSDPQLQLAKFGRQLSSEEQQQLMAMMIEKRGLNHIFGYANQNPLSFIDPYGLNTEKLWIMREAGRTAQTFAQGRKIRKVNQLCEK